MKEVKVFLALKERTARANTIAAYTRDLRNFSEYFAEKGMEDPQSISHDAILEYIQACSKRVSPTSIRRTISVLHSFYGFLVEEGERKENPMIGIGGKDVPSAAPEILTVREIEKIISIPDEGGAKGYRDRAMLEFLYATGMRVSEMLALNLEDFNPDKGTVLCGEGRRQRQLSLYPLATKELEEYFDFSRSVFCKDPSEQALFLNSGGTRMTRQGFWKILKACAEEAGIDRSISPHTIRHSVAAHLLANGARPYVVQEFLGNVDQTTIRCYQKPKKKKPGDDVMEFHPRARM